jgi:branched-chain amino acid transport system substrate-binding protein
MIRALAVLAVLATGTATPGVSQTRIVIGSSGPLSGEASVEAGILRGAAAYFRYVDSHGGVNGRTIEFTYLDDASDPARTADNVRQLAQQDHVLALFSVVGTSANLAVRDFTTAAGVPQVFSASGATTLGRDSARYPLEIGYSPPYSEEGEIYARSILATSPTRPRIAVLYQNDAYGKDLLAGLREGLRAKRGLIVQTASYESTDLDIRAEVAQLKASGANTFAIFAFGKFATEAFADAAALGWAPQIYTSQIASSTATMRQAPRASAEGSISLFWAKDPATPAFAADPGIALARRIAGGARLDGFFVTGLAEAFTMVDALEQAGTNLTRKTLMAAVLDLDEADNPFLAPGVTVHTSPTSRFPISTAQLQRWHAGQWSPFGGVQSAAT